MVNIIFLPFTIDSTIFGFKPVVSLGFKSGTSSYISLATCSNLDSSVDLGYKSGAEKYLDLTLSSTITNYKYLT